MNPRIQYQVAVIRGALDDIDSLPFVIRYCLPAFDELRAALSDILGMLDELESPPSKEADPIVPRYIEPKAAALDEGTDHVIPAIPTGRNKPQKRVVKQ